MSARWEAIAHYPGRDVAATRAHSRIVALQTARAHHPNAFSFTIRRVQGGAPVSAQPVDALAVLDEAMRHAEERGNMQRSDRLREARAAVAELVEAASAGGVMRSHGDDKECLWFGPEKAARLRAALARVQGGAA